MEFVQPDFYFNFKCIAQHCRHSCCVGWEIDIDEESLEYYKTLDGELGDYLRANISEGDNAHFILGNNERCPMLEDSGLCRLICLLGEDSLCQICSEHPRFYNFYPCREEAGLGLCCEEAARLLLEGQGPLCFDVLDDGEDIIPENKMLELREEIFKTLSDSSRNLYRRMKAALSHCRFSCVETGIKEWAKFLLSLERLDESWTLMLEKLIDFPTEPDMESMLQHVRYERLAEYFVYRHFASGDEEGAGERLYFCFLAVIIICALDCMEGYDREHTRLFSSEIEYSDENIEQILREIRRKGQ